MSGVSKVTIALIEQRPLTAVRTVSKMDPGDAALFLETLPTRHAVLVLSKMSAWESAMLIAKMAPVNGAAILSELDYQTTASIVRIITEADRENLLTALPKNLSRDLRATLTYPSDTVGAKMSISIVILSADKTAGEGLRELRQIKRSKTGIVYVVSESRKLLGIANAEELLRHPNEAVLSEVMDTSVVPISARARLSTIKSLPVWDDYAHLPVVNRQKVLIGALARRSLRQAAKKSEDKTSKEQTPSIFAAVAGAFASSAVGLLQVLTVGEAGTTVSPSNKAKKLEGAKP
jgi:magnesium transporter